MFDEAVSQGNAGCKYAKSEPSLKQYKHGNDTVLISIRDMLISKDDWLVSHI